ncbi:restriction endonuclease subunit S [Rhizobium sp. RU36D]|uniref:restriction endonuclease subunit S n=1 Tax=Rhizobium sp. RU36D TaxID=1907415 RepID=UPI0009D9118C|nr:restriction endonuclease subunit S [Rhizobium sp. RU36D]SMC75542.1 type I restriction enzyme, S subunit [Rhizobium sp. RU36D]
MSELPKGWTVVEIGSIADIVTGKTPSKSEANFYEGGDVPFFKPGDLTVGGVITTAEDRVNERALTVAPELPVGTVLVSCIGILGKSAIVGMTGTCNQQINAILPSGAATPEFVYNWSRTIKDWLEQNSSATTVAIINKGRFSAAPVPLPPLAEQKRIVAKLDALNAKSARARTELARIETLVSRYKQAVLSKAFSGELDRKELSELVVRIKAGKNLRCEERPPHWDEKGVVKVSAVTWGEFRPDQSKTLPSDFEPEEDTRIKSGDFLFSRANTIDLVGAVVIVGDTLDNLYLSDKILRLEFREPVETWLLWYLRSPMGREALMNISSGNQLSMRNIGQKSLLSLSIPYADFELRDEIVRRIESAFARIDRLAKEAKRALELVGRLDEAILAKAFRGDLVPQDENDEPAEHLLARIRAEREAVPKGRRGRGAKR